MDNEKRGGAGQKRESKYKQEASTTRASLAVKPKTSRLGKGDKFGQGQELTL
jgi:hypothetical protein